MNEATKIEVLRKTLLEVRALLPTVPQREIVNRALTRTS